MAFEINARMILELGAELISSDGIAIYELIKNALDAGSKRVRIEFYVLMTRSAYDLLIEEVETHPGKIDEVKDAVFKSVSLSGDELAVFREFLSEPNSTEGLRERLRDWYRKYNFIRVSDTGSGMSKDDLEKVFLVIGTRSRLKLREKTIAESGTPALGEKGVGRLSTMRLGDNLLVRTSKKNEANWNELEIDWTRFDHASDARLSEIKIVPRRGDIKRKSSSSGTEIIVQGLRADWTIEKLRTVAQEEFSRLVDPWDEKRATSILRVRFNGDPVDIPAIDPDLLQRAHGFCSAEYSIDKGLPSLSGRLEYTLRKKERSFSLGPAELISAAKAPSLTVLRSLGPFRMTMWWFNRGLLTVKNGYPDAGALKAEIKKWAGGLMLFRDGYRVNPYGGGDDDWLELDKRAFGAKGYKLNRQQIIGRVAISWRNEKLQDQTNREGLVATPEKAVLVALLQHVLLDEFKNFIQQEDEKVRVSESTTLETISDRVASTESRMRDKITEIAEALPAEYRLKAKEAEQLVDELVRHLDDAKELSEQYADDREQLVYLAGVGLMVEFVLHELDRGTSGTLRTLRDVDQTQLDAQTAAAVQILTDQLDTLHKRVANLEALGTVRRQTKTEFDVFALIKRAVEARSGQMRRHGVNIRGNFLSEKRWKIQAVPGMFVQIVDNLLANSLYWLKQQSMVEPGYKPEITINIDPEEGFIIFSDNGPGIDPKIAEQIFQPFVTRKPAGEGRGLGLYISREVARSQKWSVGLVKSDDIRRGRYNTFYINLSGKGRQ